MKGTNMGCQLQSDFQSDTTITRVLVLIASFALLLLAWTYRDPAPESTIGGTKVPILHCQEDEVIAFDSTQPAPYPLDCIHIDTIRAN